PATEEPAPAPAENAPAVDEPTPAPVENSSERANPSPFRQVAFQTGTTIPTPNMPGMMNPAPNAPVEFIPLEEVKESLRTRLARAAAVEEIQKRVREAVAELSAHQRAMQRYQTLLIRNEGKPVDTPKPTFNFADLANRYGFEYAELPLLDGVDLRALPLGKSQCEMGDYVTFVMGTLPEYQPVQSYDAEFNVYVSWKTETVAAKVPQFTDEGVRDKVLAAWKFEKARPLAEAAAKKMVEDCQKAQSLASLGEKVFETGPFQWVSYGPQPEIYHSFMEPEISRVEKIDTDDRKNAGKEFMRAVFSAKEGDVTLAVDRSRSTYYVVQVKKYLPTQETLQKMFTTTPLAYYKTAADADLREAGALWLNQLTQEAQLQWHRDPQSGRSESEE
ncbi:MAG: hypothetical protein Q4D62_05555, partial [Planctomycetia bacterium]|nr:hypothetical protein [Planctomycetia bacterium]